MSTTSQSPAPRSTDSRAKTILRFILAGAMTAIGILHFTNPEPFVKIVPAFLPAALVLVYVSGLAEIAGGIGILIPATRRAAGLGLIALYIAVFPANINMAVNQVSLGSDPVPAWALWLRLPFQVVFILWAHWVTAARPARDGGTANGDAGHS